MRLVIDASVAIKWILRDAPDEQDVPIALALLDEIKARRHTLVQPSHWLPEIISVIVRRSPALVDDTLEFSELLGVEIATNKLMFKRAAELSHRLKHHLFDTLYHAVALECGATLVTADERYFKVAAQEGAIVRLQDFKTQ